MTIRGIVFDFNGVIVDDEEAHFRSMQQVVAPLGASLVWQDYVKRYLSFDDRAALRRILADQGKSVSTGEFELLLEEKSRCYFKLIGDELPALDDTVNFVLALPASLPLVIASGARRDEIDFALDKLGLSNRFRGIVAADDVTRSKPHPEAFQKALQLLAEAVSGLEPSEVLVVEDSPRGIETVGQLGCRTVALTSSYPAEKLGQADLTVDSLRGWTLTAIEQQLT